MKTSKVKKLAKKKIQNIDVKAEMLHRVVFLQSLVNQLQPQCENTINLKFINQKTNALLKKAGSKIQFPEGK